MTVDTIIYCVPPIMGYLYLLWMLRAIKSMIFISTLLLVSTTFVLQVNASSGNNFSATDDEAAASRIEPTVPYNTELGYC